MAWRPNQKIDIADAPPPVENIPAAEPNVSNLPKETHQAKKREVNRAEQVRRDTDKVKDFSITLLDVDTTIIQYMDNTISPTIISEGNQVKVPVLFGSPERWKSIQKDGVHRDAKGRIQLPLIMIKRNTIQRNDGLITFNRYLNMPFERKYSAKNQYDKFSLLNNTNKPVREQYNVAMPDHIIVNYEVMIWTDLVEQNNAVIEQINWATEDYWGDAKRFKFRTSISDYNTQTEVSDGESRLIRSTFTLQVYAYLLPEIREDWRKTTQKAFTPRKIVISAELEQDASGKVWPTSSEKDYLEYNGVKNKGGVDFVDNLDSGVCRKPYGNFYEDPVRFYGRLAAWNLSIYELQQEFDLNNTTIVHPNSSLYANVFTSSAEIARSYNIYDVQKFSMGMGIVNASNSGSSNVHQQMVPWNNQWNSPDFDDGRVLVYDSISNFEWNYDNVAFNTSSNILNVTKANNIKDSAGAPINIKEYKYAFSQSRDSGLQYGVGVARAEEFETGSIYHALSMRIPAVSADFTFPAVKSVVSGSGLIPMGTRFYLNINDSQESSWLSSLSSSIDQTAAKTLVSALRDYGWIVTDISTGSKPQIDFEADSGDSYWSTIGFTGSLFINSIGSLFTSGSVVAIRDDLNYLDNELKWQV
jgi:hypothetical protein